MQTIMNFDDFEPQCVVSINLEMADDLTTQCNPERKLLVNLLERAILDLKHTDKHIKKDAEQWFLTPSSDYLFSFESVCSFLDLNATAIKEKVFKWASISLTSKQTVSVKYQGIID
jgi:hypothetical protein